MKLLVVFGIVAIVALSACVGNQGPVGPPGIPGTGISVEVDCIDENSPGDTRIVRKSREIDFLVRDNRIEITVALPEGCAGEEFTGYVRMEKRN